MSQILILLAKLLLDIYKASIDVVVFILPSTPHNLKLGTVLSGFLSEYSFMDYFVIQAASGIFGVCALVVLYKGVMLIKQ
jgi:hypothetical protein